jgi:PII-like signaling protein
MPDLVPMRLLRIYLGESDRVNGKEAYELIVHEARKQGLKGATVTRGVLGFGANSLIHTTKVLRLSEDLPMVVEIMDEAERVDAFMEKAAGYFSNGAMAVCDVMGHVSSPATKDSGKS